MVTFYTDGAYSMSRQRGGYAFVIYDDNSFIKKYYRSIDNTTNQRAEVLAVISVFRYIIKNNIEDSLIITDSMYVYGTTLQGWKMKENVDLWKIYFYFYNKIKDKVNFKHVRGHKGIEGNELADTYSVIASESKKI